MDLIDLHETMSGTLIEYNIFNLRRRGLISIGVKQCVNNLQSRYSIKVSKLPIPKLNLFE